MGDCNCGNQQYGGYRYAKKRRKGKMKGGSGNKSLAPSQIGGKRRRRTSKKHTKRHAKKSLRRTRRHRRRTHRRRR